MTLHVYRDLPATLRGSALEAHSGWPRTWQAPDPHAAQRTARHLRATIALGGLDALYGVEVRGAVVEVTRHEGVGE